MTDDGPNALEQILIESSSAEWRDAFRDIVELKRRAEHAETERDALLAELEQTREEVERLRGLLVAWWIDPDNPPAAPPFVRPDTEEEK